ncbi:MAG TPA: hypothetical protein VF607_08840, partial [Verrucomicrobiae bacterium]
TGTLTSTHYTLSGQLSLELTGPQGTSWLQFPGRDWAVPPLFSQLKATGLCQPVKTAGGRQVMGQLLVAEPAQITCLAPGPTATPTLTHLRQLRTQAVSGQRTGASLCLTGQVLTAISPGGIVALQDDTGVVLIQWHEGLPAVAPGDRVALQGTGALDHNCLYLQPAALVDNNGLHLRRDRDGVMYLPAGRVPVHLSWFNRVNPYALEIQFQGPGMPRQKIPDAAWSHPLASPNGALTWQPGLRFTAYQGDWRSLPDTAQLDPWLTGTSKNVLPQAAGPTDKLDLEFSGFLNIPRAGEYTFTLTADDGALFFADEQPVRCQNFGPQPLPTPTALVPRQVLDPDQNYRWAEVEGTIDYAYERDGSLFFELGSEYGSMKVEVADPANSSPILLLGSRVRLQGFCEGGLMPGGQGIAANFTVPAMSAVTILHASSSHWNRYPLQDLQQLPRRPLFPHEEIIAHLSGELHPAADFRSLQLVTPAGSIAAFTAQAIPTNLTGQVEVLGRVNRSETNVWLSAALVRPATGS